MATQDQVISALAGTLSSHPLRTIEVARKVFGSNATSKMVNPMLYSLQKTGITVKISEDNGSNPRWYLSEEHNLPS